MGNPTTKHCPKCNTVLSIESFNRNRTTADGYASWCRECMRLYLRGYYTEKKPTLADKYRAYQAKHRDRIADYQREYRAQHPDLYQQRKQYYQELYQRNRDAIRKAQREYQRQHPELSARRTMRYYARKQGAQGTHTSAEWIALRAWFGNRCACCGATRRLEADHVIPLSRGGSDEIENIQPLCRSCNSSKATDTTDYRNPDALATFLALLREPD